jgi:hypothetical protein
MNIIARPPENRKSGRELITQSIALTVVGLCATFFGCAKDVSALKYPLPEDRIRRDGVAWRWEDYSNRVWISVTGVGLQTGLTNAVKKIAFSYSPNTGKSLEDAIAITAFDMFAGSRAERFLLRVLYGTGSLTPLNPSEIVTNGKAFHIYTLSNRIGETNAVYFDGTHYHGIW